MMPHGDTARPWMTALEMQFAALRRARIVRDAPPSLDPWVRFKFDLAALQLPQCEAFSWTSETAAAVGRAAQTVPASSILSSSTVLPVRAWWWYFVDALPMRVRGENIAALSCSSPDDVDSVQVIAYRLTGREPEPVAAFDIPEGTTLADLSGRLSQGSTSSETDITEAIQIAQFIVAACAWLQQRIVVATSGHIERHRRKQIARDHRVPEPLDVKVIQLRRLESPSRATTGSDPVAWSCRWVVNGHWRNQPYKDERKLIYILPFVKGPADMPLKVPTHTVYQVTR